MPYVHCLTNQKFDAAAEEAFKAGAANVMAKVAGKGENWLFVACTGGQSLYVRGQKTPGALLQVSMVGKLNAAQKKDLSARLGRLCEEILSVPSDSVYLIFNEVAGENWGWNGSTFG